MAPRNVGPPTASVEEGKHVAGGGEERPQHDAASDRGMEALLDGLTGEARRDRAELIAWLVDRGFTEDQIGGSLTPMMLPANRVMGDDGKYVSAREMVRQTGIDLDLLQQLMRAAGLPRIDDPDAAVVPRADAQAAAHAKYLIDMGLDAAEAVAVLKVLTEGLRRTALMMRKPAFRVIVKRGASEIEFAKAAEAAARASTPLSRQLVADLLLTQYRHMFEAEAISAAEREAGSLPGSREVAITFADLVGFTQLGETLPPEQLVDVASQLAEIARDVAVAPVWFVKTIGDAVMLVSRDTARLIDTVLELIEVAEDRDLPRLRAGVASGLAVSRAGDWFGSPVNVANRVTALARPGTVLVTDSARESSGEGNDLIWWPAGEHRLRGVPRPVELYGVRRASSNES
jgi:adenylate cyclase